MNWKGIIKDYRHYRVLGKMFCRQILRISEMNIVKKYKFEL